MCVSASATILTLLRSSFDWAPWSAPADSPGGRCLLAARPSCFSLIVDSSTLGISAHKQHDFLSELYEMIPFKPRIPVSSSSVRMHPNEGGADHIACKASWVVEFSARTGRNRVHLQSYAKCNTWQTVCSIHTGDFTISALGLWLLPVYPMQSLMHQSQAIVYL